MISFSLRLNSTPDRYFDLNSVCDMIPIFIARKWSLRRLCFHRCPFVHGGHALHACPPLPCMTPCHTCRPLPRMPYCHAHPPCTTKCGQWAGGTHPTGMHSCWWWKWNSSTTRIQGPFKIPISAQIMLLGFWRLTVTLQVCEVPICHFQF